MQPNITEPNKTVPNLIEPKVNKLIKSNILATQSLNLNTIFH